MHLYTRADISTPAISVARERGEEKEQKEEPTCLKQLQYLNNFSQLCRHGICLFLPKV